MSVMQIIMWLFSMIVLGCIYNVLIEIKNKMD